MINSTHIWISTRTGAFSPALEIKKSPFQPNYDAFYKHHSREPIMMDDARKNPICSKHPGVAGRPNLKFFYGGPMISRDHLLGILYLWQAEVNPLLPVEKVDRLKELAKKAVDALQLEMFKTLGAFSEKEKAEIELPALWLDVSTPRWQIMGANSNWVKLTGVSMADMANYPGLLDFMVPVNEARLLKAVAAVNRDYPRSIPLIMSPRARQGSTLQFAFALKPYSGPLPEGIASSEIPVIGGDIWKVEVHALVQAVESEYKVATRAHRYGSIASTISTFAGDGMMWQGSNSSAGGGGGGGVNDSRGPNNNNYIFSSKASSDKASHALSVSLGPPGSLQGASDVTIPPRLATLQLGELLGKGSYGKVYFGTLNDRPVAVKVMQAPPGSSDLLWAAQYETMVASDLEHDNIVQTIDWCEHVDPMLGGIVWIVQELCDLGSLNVALENGLLRKDFDKTNPPDMHAYLESAIDVARGMQYLHHYDVVHGDLSSNNIMLVSVDNDRGFIAKINDFGLSRALGGQDVSTKTIGTISHMCPELLLDGIHSKSGDVYSFGVALWEMWSGTRAWSGCSQAQVIFAVTCAGTSLKIPANAPEEVVVLMKECLAPRASRPTFDEIVPRLEAMLAKVEPTEL
jgi:Protein tyrosine and serine/threonine kinase